MHITNVIAQAKSPNGQVIDFSVYGSLYAFKIVGMPKTKSARIANPTVSHAVLKTKNEPMHNKPKIKKFQSFLFNEKFLKRKAMKNTIRQQKLERRSVAERHSHPSLNKIDIRLVPIKIDQPPQESILGITFF